MVSGNLLEAVRNWEVSNENSFSDHRFIETTLSLDPPTPAEFVNLRRTNWCAYREDLLNILPIEPPNDNSDILSLDNNNLFKKSPIIILASTYICL